MLEQGGTMNNKYLPHLNESKRIGVWLIDEEQEALEIHNNINQQDIYRALRAIAWKINDQELKRRILDVIPQKI